MLFILGIGSVVALQNVVVTVLCDQFSSLKYERVAAVTSVLGFFCGLMYITPVSNSFNQLLSVFFHICIYLFLPNFLLQGGQWMITLVDNFGGTLPIFALGIFELIAIFFFYGLENFCIDVEFMTGRYVTFYWRICWIFLAPLTMTIVFIYSTITMKPLTYAGLSYPTEYMIAGWGIFLFAMLQLPIWFIWHVVRSKKSVSFLTALKNSFHKTDRWGPRDPNNRTEWIKYKEEIKQRSRTNANAVKHSKWIQKIKLAFGKY